MVKENRTSNLTEGVQSNSILHKELSSFRHNLRFSERHPHPQAFFCVLQCGNSWKDVDVCYPSDENVWFVDKTCDNEMIFSHKTYRTQNLTLALAIFVSHNIRNSVCTKKQRIPVVGTSKEKQ